MRSERDLKIHPLIGELPPFSAGIQSCDPEKRGFLNLALGESPYGMSPLAQKALLQAVLQRLPYPDSSCENLTERIAAHFHVPPNRVFVGNGVDELILISALTFLAPQDRCLVNGSTFAGFEAAVKRVRATPLYSPLNGAQFDVDHMAFLLQRSPRLWFLCHPHNPTGTILERSQLRRLLEIAHRHEVVTIIDEAYAEYADPMEFESATTLLDRYPRLIAMRTFSKIYGMAGLRCGYAIGHPDLIQELKKIKHVLPFNVNALALEAGCAAMKDQQFVRDCYAKTEAVKAMFCAGLTQLGLSYVPSHTNFVLVQVDREADLFHEELRDHHHILVRSGQPFGFPRHVRVTLGTADQMNRLLSAFEDCLKHREFATIENNFFNEVPYGSFCSPV